MASFVEKMKEKMAIMEEEDFEEGDGIYILLGLWWETLLGN